MDYGLTRIVLIRAKRNSDSFEPVLFHRYDEISLREKLLLAYKAAVIGKAGGIMPTHGQIIYGEEFNTIRVILSPFIAKAEQIVHDIEELRGSERNHRYFSALTAMFASFSRKCRSKAVEEDNLSLASRNASGTY